VIWPRCLINLYGKPKFPEDQGVSLASVKNRKRELENQILEGGDRMLFFVVCLKLQITFSLIALLLVILGSSSNCFKPSLHPKK
jgi:hypothetical protein